MTSGRRQSWWQRLRHGREDRQLQQRRVSPGQWQEALGDWAVYRRYPPEQQRRIQDLALRLLLRKHLLAVNGAELDDRLRLRIAGMAVVPEIGRASCRERVEIAERGVIW